MSSFDFDPEFLISIAMGDLSAKDYPHIKIEALYEPQPFRNEVVAGLKVSIEPDVMWTIREALNTKRIAHEDMERTMWEMYHGIARKMSFRLFEKDPRIGLPLAEGFPNCPLFDPPYLRAPIRTYLMKGGDGVWKKQPDTVEVKKTLTTCPFCQDSIHPFDGSRRLGLWCGGNVGFAHEECAPWVTPRH